MAIKLGPHQYGKAQDHLVRAHRHTDRHEIRDLTVSTSLRGAFVGAYTAGAAPAAALPPHTRNVSDR